VSTRSIRRRCRDLVAQLEIPRPFTAERLAQRISASRGRPLDLLPVPMPSEAPSGIWFATADRDVIVYEQYTSPLHQEHIKLHELGHLLCGHEPIAATSTQTSRLLFADLDPQVVRRSLHRSHYTAREEQEAELVASLVLARARRLRPAPEWAAPAEIASISRRVALALESPDEGS
jgi:hypothetical protein